MAHRRCVVGNLPTEDTTMTIGPNDPKPKPQDPNNPNPNPDQGDKR